MYKNVVALGDSFMEGAELAPGEEVATLLAKHWHCELYNLAASGTGILGLIEQVKLAEQGGALTPDSFVIYSLPPAGRIDIPYNDSSKIVLDYWFHKKIMDGTFDLPNPVKAIDTDPNFLRFKEVYHALGPTADLILFGEQIHYSGVVAFMNLLEKYPNRAGIIGHPQHCFDNYYNEKLYAQVKSRGLLFVDGGFTGWAAKNKFPIMPGGHPGAQAHRVLFELIASNDEE